MIDKNKKYRTRSGRDVTIYAADVGKDREIHGCIDCGDGFFCQFTWRSDGRALSDKEHDLDLIEVMPETEIWIVLNERGGVVCASPDYKSALEVASKWPGVMLHKVSLGEETAFNA